MAIVLTLAGVFVYLRVSSDLSSSIDDALRTRVDDLVRTIQSEGPDAVVLSGAGDEGAEDIRSEVLRPDGQVVVSSEDPATGAILDQGELAAASRGLMYFDGGEVSGIENEARLLARPVRTLQGTVIAVSGTSTGDRAETLAGLITTFVIGGPLALILASALGYGLAALAMRPVEAMRAQAGRISLERRGERLPLPPSADEIGRLGRTLNEMLDRIETSLDRQRSFVADASHELRTPLAVIRAELELGQRPDRDSHERAQAMSSAAEEVDRLQHLTDDLLDLARSDGGPLPLERRSVSVAGLLEGSRRRAAARAASAGRVIDVEIAADLVADLDPARMEIAIDNLLDNALRHGGGPVEVAARRHDDALEIAVCDQGPGFPEAFEPKAFERFSRAETGRTSTGSGLGLAIVRAIAGAHGGAVEIEPQDGAGACVVLRLPLVAADAPR